MLNKLFAASQTYFLVKRHPWTVERTVLSPKSSGNIGYPNTHSELVLAERTEKPVALTSKRSVTISSHVHPRILALLKNSRSRSARCGRWWVKKTRRQGTLKDVEESRFSGRSDCAIQDSADWSNASCWGGALSMNQSRKHYSKTDL
jgi:hypothetical protein